MSSSKIIDKIYPSYELIHFPLVKNIASVPKHIVHFLKDPLLEFKKFSVHNMVELQKSLDLLHT